MASERIEERRLATSHDASGSLGDRVFSGSLKRMSLNTPRVLQRSAVGLGSARGGREWFGIKGRKPAEGSLSRSAYEDRRRRGLDARLVPSIQLSKNK